MTGSIAIDVVIGLVFIYLLYSLFVSILAEMISTALHLRAKNLETAIGRMLAGSQNYLKTKWYHIFPRFRKYENSKGTLIDAFFTHSSINLLKEDPTLKPRKKILPSYISADNFCETLWEIFKDGTLKDDFKKGGNSLIEFKIKLDKFFSERIETKDANGNPVFQIKEQPVLDEKGNPVLDEKRNPKKEPVPNKAYDFVRKKLEGIFYKIQVKISAALEKESAGHEILKNELEKLKKRGEELASEKYELVKVELDEISKKIEEKVAKLIEKEAAFENTLKSVYEDYKKEMGKWFDETMERSIEWYKKKMQIILMFLGLGIAVIFNVDSIKMAQKLAMDKDAREKIVASAIAASEDEGFIKKIDRGTDTIVNPKDSSVTVIDTLSPKSDSLIDRLNRLYVIGDSMNKQLQSTNAVLGLGFGEFTAGFDCQKHSFFWNVGYFFRCFAGWLLTALALSLGAPFWFDILKKVVQIRTAFKGEAGSTEKEKAEKKK